MKIIPAILTANQDDLARKLNFLAAKTDWVQIDFVDQRFNSHPSLRPENISLSLPSTTPKIECHLMVENPFAWVWECEKLMPQRLVAQIETVKNQLDFLERVNAEGLEIGFALDLATPLEQLRREAAFNADVIIVLGATAGRSGQKFHPQALAKIQALRELRRQLEAHFAIGLDGGIHPAIFPQLKANGVDLIYLNSALWQASSWEERWQQLQEKIKDDKI